MRQQNAFRADIFFKFDLENDILTMTFMYNHFENKWNQLRHTENPTIYIKVVKIGPWTPQDMPLSLYSWWPSWIWPKKWVKGVEKLEPYDFLVSLSLMMQYPPLTQFGQTNLANTIFVTSQPPLLGKSVARANSGCRQTGCLANHIAPPCIFPLVQTWKNVKKNNDTWKRQSFKRNSVASVNMYMWDF